MSKDIDDDQKDNDVYFKASIKSNNDFKYIALILISVMSALFIFVMLTTIASTKDFNTATNQTLTLIDQRVIAVDEQLDALGGIVNQTVKQVQGLAVLLNKTVIQVNQNTETISKVNQSVNSIVSNVTEMHEKLDTIIPVLNKTIVNMHSNMTRPS